MEDSQELWEEYVQGALDHVLEEYGEPPDQAKLEYPYKEWKSRLRNEPELLGKDLLFWFTVERIKPETGKTELEEFTEQKTKDPAILEKIAQIRHVVADDFTVLRRKNGGKEVILRDLGGRTYNTKINGESGNYKPGTVIKARLYKWGNGYKYCSISLIKQMPQDLRSMNLAMLDLIDDIRKRREKSKRISAKQSNKQ